MAIDKRRFLIAALLVPIGLIGGTVARLQEAEWYPRFRPIDYEWRDGTLWMHLWNDVKGWTKMKLTTGEVV